MYHLKRPEPEAVYTCSSCNQDICEGDLFVDHGYDKYCLFCLEELTPRDLLRLLDHDVLEAQGGDF